MANATNDHTPPLARDPFEVFTDYIASNPAPLIDQASDQCRQLVTTFNALIDAIACRSDQANLILRTMRQQLAALANTQHQIKSTVNSSVRLLLKSKFADIHFMLGIQLALLSERARTAAGDEVHEGLRHVG